MAYTSLIPVRRLDRAVKYVRDKTKTTKPSSLEEAVDYALNRDKTESVCFETGLSCLCETAFTDMRANNLRWHKTGGVQGYHLVQSFAEGEVTPELAHQIGVELADQLLNGRYQAIVTTHLNTSHIHNHIVWCAVALDNGRKYHSNARSYYTEVRARSDALCRQYGLSVIETPESERGKRQYAKWQAEAIGQPTWRTAIRMDIDEVVSMVLTWRQFLTILEQKGYEIRMGRKYPTLRPPGKERFVRFKTLGKAYTPEAIRQRILYPKCSFAPPAVWQGRLHGTHRKARKLTGLRALYYRYLYELGALPRKPQRPSYAVRQDILIRNEDELIHAMNHFELRGGGGTDFRPAFAYVDQLCAEKKFSNLRGLLYFTDGMGTYPARRPGYDTAFLFLGERFDDANVPPWAMKVVLDEEEFTGAAARPASALADALAEEDDLYRELNNS